MGSSTIKCILLLLLVSFVSASNFWDMLFRGSYDSDDIASITPTVVVAGPLNPTKVYFLRSSISQPQNSNKVSGSFFLGVDNQKSPKVNIKIQGYGISSSDYDYFSCASVSSSSELVLKSNFRSQIIKKNGVYGIPKRFKETYQDQCINYSSSGNGVDSLKCGDTVYTCFGVCIEVKPYKRRASSFLEYKFCSS
jgi:hypothetical protein